MFIALTVLALAIAVVALKRLYHDDFVNLAMVIELFKDYLVIHLALVDYCAIDLEYSIHLYFVTAANLVNFQYHYYRKEPILELRVPIELEFPSPIH